MNFQPGNLSGMTTAGAMTQGDLAALQKSLEAGYETNVDGMTGGSALRIQSLDMNLKATVQDNQHFALFNALPKPRATAVLDEWTEQHSIGGFFGQTFNTQDGAAAETNGEYERQVGMVKYLSTYRKIPLVLEHQNNIVDAVSVETTNGTKQLLTDIEVFLFEGDDNVLPLAFNGIRRQIQDLGSPDHVIDLKGGPLNDIYPIATAAEVVWGYGNFGVLTDIYIPPSVQTDLNQDLDPAFRVLLNNSAQTTVRGTSVSAIQTTYGAISTRNDMFIRDEKLKKVFQILSPIAAAVAAANALFMPGKPTVTAVASPVIGSEWQQNQDGQYVYAVSGLSQAGESQIQVTDAVAVEVGGSLQISIPASAGKTETGYVIYRGRRNGPAAGTFNANTPYTDFREMVRIPYDRVNRPATTTYTDLNTEIPGSTNAYLLNLRQSDGAIDWRQYLPMMKLPMAAVNSPIIPWLQMICGYLRISKRNQHVVVKNIITNSQKWKPFDTPA